MIFIKGQSREQLVLIPESLDGLIGSDNEVRMIDLFVEAIKLSDYQFIIKDTSEGRPAYYPMGGLNGLFLYQY